MTALILAYLFTVDGLVADGGGGWLTAYQIDRLLLVEAPAGMSALRQNRTLIEGSLTLVASDRYLPQQRHKPLR